MILLFKILDVLMSSIIAISSILLGLTLSEITFEKLQFLNKLIEQKEVLLIVLIISTILLILNNSGRYIFENRKKKKQLIYKTIGIENINFIYNTKPWGFQVDKNGEDIMSIINPPEFRGGLVTEFPYESNYIKIAEGYMYIIFTLENHGDFLSIVDNIVLEVIGIYKMPKTARFNFYKPVLQPEQDLVILNKDQKKYKLFNTKTYKYSKGDVDKFRLKVQINDKTEDLIYKFRIIAYSRIGGKTTAVESDKTYFISTHKGPSNDQAEAKEEETFNIEKLFLSNREGRHFAKCVLSLKEGNVREAKEVLDERINFLKGLLNLRSNINDGDPPLVDCLFLRVHINLYLKNKKAAKQDLEFIEKTIKSDGVKKIKKELNNFSRQLAGEEDSYKYLYEMSELSLSVSRHNSRGKNIVIINKIR